MLSSSITHLQKSMQTKVYQLGHLLPVWPHVKLLGSGRHQSLIAEVQQLSGLSEPHFKALYRPVMKCFAEFVQLIPEEPGNSLGGLLNLGLTRGLLGLRQYAQSGVKIDVDPLINYAIFTAGLFYDVGKVISQQKIVIADIAGNYLQDWFPYSGTLVEQGAEFYKLYPYNMTIYEAVNHEAAALLARQMMPKEGFLWLSSDLEIFIDWMDALRGETGEGGRRITRILSLIPWQDIVAFMKNLSDTLVELISPPDMPLEDQFYIWFREGLANGTIAVNTNEANVHILEDQILYINNELFKSFLDAKKLSADANKLAGQFNERFGIETQSVSGKVEYAAFLGGAHKSIQVRRGMFALGSAFIMDIDTTGIPLISPLQKEIKAALQTSRPLPDQLPSVKQTLGADRNPSSFKMK